jgi:hypothetical protein
MRNVQQSSLVEGKIIVLLFQKKVLTFQTIVEKIVSKQSADSSPLHFISLGDSFVELFALQRVAMEWEKKREQTWFSMIKVGSIFELN